MKRIENTFYRFVNVIVGVLLTAIGFGTSSCVKKYGVPDLPNPMYGVPHADLMISGNVTDSQTEEPLQNIQIVAKTSRDFPLVDTLYTDENGYFNRFYQGVNWQEDSVWLSVSDTAGVYESQQTGEAVNYSGSSDSWYEGSADIHFDIKLKKK